MLNNDYLKTINAIILPSDELLRRTREKMLLFPGRTRRGWSVLPAAACLLLVAASLFLRPWEKGDGSLISGFSANIPAVLMDVCAVKEDRACLLMNGTLEHLDERAIFQTEAGSLFPAKILSGYVFEEASVYTGKNGEKNYSLTYTMGYDYLSIRLKRMDPRSEGRIVSVLDETAYDITRYEIPLADSVPELLRETIDNPIFLAEELTPRALSLRVFNRGTELGEDDARYSVNFSVLCGEWEVSYSIKGDDMNGLWEMVRSSGYFH